MRAPLKTTVSLRQERQREVAWRKSAFERSADDEDDDDDILARFQMSLYTLITLTTCA